MAKKPNGTSKSTAIAKRPKEPARPQSGGALADLRSRAMSVPIEVMHVALGEYATQRREFRDWVLEQMTSGIHYGYPPKTAPKLCDDGSGDSMVWTKGKWERVPKDQWRPKPSLYAAGADFICDLLGLMDTYEADMQSWEQLGKPPNVFVTRCTLLSRATGDKVAEGPGAFFLHAGEGKNASDPNVGIKMSQKRSKVSAVLNAYGLRDLFTQDLENQMPAHENPAQKADVPRQASRDDRKKEKPVTRDELMAVGKEYADKFPAGSDADLRTAFTEFVFMATGANFDISKAQNWNQSLLQLTKDKLAKVPHDAAEEVEEDLVEREGIPYLR